MMKRKWIIISLLVVFCVVLPCRAEDSSPTALDGYAARWVVVKESHTKRKLDIVLSDEVSGSVNEAIGRSNFYEQYSEYGPVGSFQWLEQWIQECAIVPVVIGDQLVLEGGAPYICVEESGCPILAEARESAVALDAAALGHPLWVIGKWQDWLLCAMNFSNWIYEDEPTSLEYGWVHSSHAQQLPAGLWAGSLDEYIEDNCEWMLTGEANTTIYSEPNDDSEPIALLPAQTELPVYPCLLDDDWAIVWFENRWGYIRSESVNHIVADLEGASVTFTKKPLDSWPLYEDSLLAYNQNWTGKEYMEKLEGIDNSFANSIEVAYGRFGDNPYGYIAWWIMKEESPRGLLDGFIECSRDYGGVDEYVDRANLESLLKSNSKVEMLRSEIYCSSLWHGDMPQWTDEHYLIRIENRAQGKKEIHTVRMYIYCSFEESSGGSCELISSETIGNETLD